MLHTDVFSKWHDRVAIVGIGCLLPGGVETADGLWQLLRRGDEGVIDVPAERWNVDAVYDPVPGTPGKTASRRAGLLGDIAAFDAGFFGISPREAAVMDPQQRLLLEVTWRALEDAGIPAESLAGSDTGVYIGISHSDYDVIQQFSRRQIDVHTATGGALSIAANRLSHRFDLRGPSLAIDTACSSSLVALDAACAALLAGECETVLVGGVNAILTPDVTITLSRATMLSPDGRCKAFDARANGYVRAEGAGIVVLKLMSRALSDGDRIHAAIGGTAVNQDGRTSTITVPNRDAQIAMLRQACKRADVDPSRIGYVEAHGTGTAVGDPIEASAIGAVFGQGRGLEHPCIVGSIKTNIGHLEPAAGVAGLIKAALCVKNGEIPPSLHFDRPNPSIDFSALGIRVQRTLSPWPTATGPRIAAVNSFGFGGTNACAIVEEPPPPREVVSDRARSDWRPALVAVSAASRTALTALCTDLAQALEERSPSFADLVGTLGLRRSHLEHRLAVVATSCAEAAVALRGFAAGAAPKAVVSGRRSNVGRLAFVFTGQGSQWWGMGRGLLQEDPLFRAVVERCDALFSERSGWSLIEQLLQPEEHSRINETSVAQPTIFALQVALAERLAASGIRPQVVVGHSIGEIAAAHVAGALSLSQAVDVVHHRSRLQERSRLQGGMAAVGLAADRVRPYLERFEGQLEVAAINGPELVSIAGPRPLLDELVADVGRERGDVLCQVLRIDYAFHSFQMDPLTDELRANLGDLRSKALDVAMISTVTGEAIEGERLDADYWCRNMRQPVLFRRAIDRAVDAGVDTFLELGAHPSLVGPIRACLAERGREGLAVGTLHRERPDAEAIASAIGSLHVHGVTLDWTALVPRRWKFVELPGYPWEKQVHWVEPEESRAARFNGPAHPLLGYRLASTEPIWQSEVDASSPHYLQDHRLEGAVVFPAAGFVELMLAAARETLGEGPHEVEAITFHEALFLDEEIPTLIETAVDRARGIVRVMSRQRGAEATWVLRATGRIRRWPACDAPIEQWTPKVEPPVQVGRARLYRVLAEEGHTFGPAFQAIETIWYAEGCSLGKIVLPSSIDNADKYLLHPVRLDACLQVIRGFRSFAQSDGGIALPLGIGRLRFLRRPSGPIFARAQVLEDSAYEIAASISIVDDAGRLVATIDDFRCRRVAKSVAERTDVVAGFYRERWVPLPAGSAPSPAQAHDCTGSWLILSDRGGLGEALARLIVERGGRCALAFKASRAARRAEERFETATSTASLRRTLAEMVEPPTRVVHLWALDEEGGCATASGLARVRRIGVEEMLALTRALVTQPVTPRLWVMTGDAADRSEMPGADRSLLHAALTGFLRSLANEHPDFRPALIDLDPQAISPGSLLDEMLGNGGETEIRLRNGDRRGLRLEPIAEKALPARRRRWDAKARMPAFRVVMSAPGVIDNLTLAAVSRPAPQPGEVEIEVRAVGLNFRDVIAATGLMPPGAEDRPAWQWLGYECAGVVSAVGEGVDPSMIGRRVAAVTPGCLASHVTVPVGRVFPVSRRLSFAAAAAIPVAFATAHYGLVTLARLKPGERVLIHSAAGGVGLAAVAIAQAVGAEILATAGSQEKRRHLYRCGIKHVFDSRSLAFADDVMWKTADRGVDVVLNSLPGPFIEKSLSVLAPGGRFLEIGKRDIYADTPLGLHAMRNNAAFHAIDLTKLAHGQPEVLRAEIDKVLPQLARGTLQLMPLTVFPASKVADAFRRMSETGHIGKVIVSFDDRDASVYEHEGVPLPVASDATYLVTGGQRGLGLATARWLVDNGARSLVLVGRSSAPSDEARAALDDLRSAGAAVVLVGADIGTRTGAKAALEAVARTGLRLGGVVHAAGVIEDALIVNLTVEQIRRVFNGKALGALHLHELTQSLPLDFFVLYSSVAAALGTPGQAHYTAANRVLEAIAAIRRSRGLPATAIALGAIGDAGYLTRRQDVARYIIGAGIQPLATATALAALGAVLRRAPMNVAFAEIDWSKLAQSFALVTASARTSGLVRSSAAGDSGPDRQVRSAILASPEAQRPAVVSDYLHGKVAMVLKVDPGSVEIDRPLREIGLDSLTAFELKNRIETELGVTLPVGQFLQRPTISALVPAVIASLASNAGGHAATTEADGLGLGISIGQEALWFIDRLAPGNPAYGLAACVSFRPHVDDGHIDKIIQSLVLQNENLRFAFPSDGLGPVPNLLPPDQYRLIRHDATHLSEVEFSGLLHAEANRPFHLGEGPLSRLHLFRRSDCDVMLLQFHHIVADAASIAILLDDVLEGYFALQAGLPLPTRQHAPFRRFIAWQRAVVAGPQGERHRRYWRQTLAGAPPSLLLATDHPRALDSLGPGASRSFIMKGVIVEELKGLARAEGTTLFSLLLAAFNVLLHRYSGATDIIVGTPVSGRTQSDFERMVGYLVNAMPIRARVSPDRSFQAVLADVDAAIRSSLEHQDYPFSTIVEDLDPPRQQGCFPFFQIMFGMERFDSTDPRGLAATLLNMAGPAITYREYTVESVAVSRSRAPFDMTFTIEEFDNQIFGVVDYRCDLWEGHSIDRLIEHYEAILHQVVASPLRRISELTLGRPAAQPMRGRALLDRPDVMTSLQQVVAAVPDGIAVSDAAGDLSYRTLLRRIDGLASTMANRGIGRGSRVAICLGRTRELPIALLATLATGAAYIPLDPSYPRARLAAIIDDAKPDIVVADRDGVALLPADTSALLAESCVEAATAFASARIEANDLAYIIHTSGSTGRPVGVEIGRGALANFLAAMRAELPLSSTDSLLAVTPYSFDIAVLELLLPLTLGARVVIADEVVARDGRLLDARLDRGDVTLMQATPATWQMLIDGGWKGTGRLTALCGGEMLAPSLAAGILARGASLWNLYGPTETTVWSTLARVVDARAISIGRPIADTSCLVVDDTLQPVGAGIVGELLIGGAGLAHGYHNDPVRTAERFIPDPVDPDGRRVFRTGDLVRVQPDGMLQFVGRRDQQIKLRGFRVELGEIEAMLGQHPSVRSAAVLAVGDDLDSRRLVAFVEADERAAEHGLAAHLRKRLPSYMVPDAIRLTAAIPRLPNGKVDRRRLADEARLPPQRALASARPSTPVETQLVALLEELMRHASIGLHDNFFSIGGTSLLGMRYVARINDVYGVGIGASELMRAPTVASMAQLIAGLVAGAIPETGDRAVRMDTPIGRRLWRPLAMARAEGAFDEIDAAAIACLPDDLLEIARRNGAEAAVRGRLPRADDPQWGAVCRLKRGTIALVVVPRFEIDLIGDQATAVGAVEAAMDYARRLGARTVSLTGIIPAVTDFGRALTPCHGVAVTTGQATTASAVALSAIAAAQAAQRDMQHETIAFVGLGGIGAATLRLLLDQAIHPSALLLCDLPARQSELERLADEVRTDAGYRGDIEVALANGAIPAQVYGSRFIIGGASFPGVLEIDRLAAGTIVIDDAAPRRFDTDRAISRMTSRGDVLLVEGDLVSPPGAIDWTVTLPASVPALGHYPATGLLSDSSAITGCVLASLISQDPDVPTTTGPLTPAICRDHWEALRRMGIGAAPLRCGSWFPNRAYLARFGDLYARPGG